MSSMSARASGQRSAWSQVSWAWAAGCELAVLGFRVSGLGFKGKLGGIFGLLGAHGGDL